MRRVVTKHNKVAPNPVGAFVEVVREANSSKESQVEYLPIGEAGAPPEGFVSPVYPIGDDQALSGAGMLQDITLTSPTTTIATTGAATAYLIAGTVVGHMKTFKMIADLGDCVITVEGDLVNSITLNDVDDECDLSWTGTGWTKISNIGCIIA